MSRGDPTAATIRPQDLGFGVLFGVVRDAVIVADVRSQEIVLWNAAAGDIFGYTPDEVVGRPLEVLVPPELRPQHRAGIARYRETGHGPLVDGDRPVEVPALRRDGQRIQVELKLSPLPQHGRRAYVLAMVRDVTERTRLAEELATANLNLQLALDAQKDVNLELRRLMTLKDDMVHMLAHDFRAPLTAILGFAELLRERDDVDDRRRQQALDSIAGGARRLERLVQYVLDTAQLESATLAYDIVAFDIGQVVRSAIEELGGAFGAERFRLEVAPQLPAARGDPARHLQVAVNLLSNAAKFSPPDRPVEVQVHPHQSALTVTVKDYGPGVPTELQEKVFDKFVRADPPDEGRAAGTGLGLYIARRLVEDQGGRIWLESAPGQGATFFYTVPCD